LRIFASNVKFFVPSLDPTRVSLADRLHGALKMMATCMSDTGYHPQQQFAPQWLSYMSLGLFKLMQSRHPEGGSSL
jgi:hypothetical protein